MYHHLSSGRYGLDKKLFAAHMQYLRQCPNVEITVDDGHIDCLAMADMMENENLKGRFFIVINWLNKKGFLTKETVKNLAERGHKIGLHGKDHDFYTSYSKETLIQYLSEGQKELQEITGKSVNELSFPGGRFNRHSLLAAREVGFNLAWSSEPGHWQRDHPLKRCGRDCLLQGCSLGALEALVTGHRDSYREWRYRILSTARKILGEGTYHKIS